MPAHTHSPAVPGHPFSNFSLACETGKTAQRHWGAPGCGGKAVLADLVM